MKVNPLEELVALFQKTHPEGNSRSIRNENGEAKKFSIFYNFNKTDYIFTDYFLHFNL